MNPTPLHPGNGGEGRFSVGHQRASACYGRLFLEARIIFKSPAMAGCSNLSAAVLPSSKRGLRTGLGIVFWLLATATQAQVYKWTDAAGQVHYGDRPSTQFPSEQIEVTAPPADSAATGLRPGERKLLQEVTTEERRLTRQRQTQAREEARHGQAEAARRRTRCESYRRRLQRLEDKLVTGYRAGESDRLHELRDDYQMKIREYCD